MINTTLDLQTETKNIYNRINSYRNGIASDKGSLLNNAGCALFLYHYSELLEDENAYDLAGDYCDKLIEDLRNYHFHYPSSISLCSGVLGSAWALNYLRKERFVDFGNDLDDMDQLAERFFYNSLAVGCYDYLHGALGALTYLLSLPKSINREQIISKMLDAIVGICNTERGLLFLNEYDLKLQKVNKGVINLGLSHGTPSLIAVLCFALNYSDRFSYLKNHIANCAYTIISFQNVKETKSHFSYKRSLFDDIEGRTRLGW
ncbi:MAG: hypothetical protein EOP48_28540, partial [Sphingobacteriales bacterium]